METVNDPAAEREPDHVTPIADMTAAEAAELRALFAGNPVIDGAETALREFGVLDGELADVVRLLLAWPEYEELTERELRGAVARFVAEPDGLTLEQVALEREIEGLDDADDHFVIGQTWAGWPGTEQPLPAYAAMGQCPCGAEPGYLCQNAVGEQLGEPHPERLPVPGSAEILHFRTLAVASTGCGVDANTVDVRCTDDRAQVTCVECTCQLVDEELAEPEVTEHCGGSAPHGPHEWASSRPGPRQCLGTPVASDVRHFAALADAHTLCGLERATVRWTDDPATPVDCPACNPPMLAVPERRTVSLEVLTDELRAKDEADQAGVGKVFGGTVGIVCRLADVVVITEVDTLWVAPYRKPADVLAILLRQARMYADTGNAELLMPTPDVLAALDGRPDAQLLTAPVHVLAMDIKAGMLLRSTDDDGDGAETLELVSAVDDCTDRDCIHGASCVVLTVSGHEDPDVHFGGYGRVEVRIPCAVNHG